MPIGKRIYLKRHLPSKELVAAFAEIPASNIADCMNRDCAMNPRIRLMSSPTKPINAGPAYTVKARSGDNLALHAALDHCQEGDVIVVSNEEGTERSLIGEIMFTNLMLNKKIAGIVIDGPIRDSDAASQMAMPIYATGTTPGGPYKEGPGEVNVPIACGGISVNPGDIIVMDPDGVICIPLKDAEALLPEAQAYKEADGKKLINAQNNTSNRAWVQKTLDAKGFEIIDGIYGEE